MAVRIGVQGVGVVGGFGCGVADLAAALAGSGKPPARISVPTGRGQIDLPAFRADTSSLKDYVPPRTLRRIDQFSRLALLGGHLALADAGLPEAERGRLGLIVASGFGATGMTFAFVDSFINDGDLCASPTHFANSVHNSAAANLSIHLGARGPCLTVSQFHLSVPSALATARVWLLEGRVDRLLFGAVDELSELIGYVWHRRRGTPDPLGMAPLCTGRETAVPGEGAAFFLLSRAAGDGAGYCSLDDVATGSARAAGPPLPPAGLLVLGADGRAESGRRYAAAAENGRIACFTPVYGSMPAGPAFDLAAAALILRRGTVFPTPGGAARDFPAAVAAAGEPLDAERVSCLAFDEDGGFGLVTLGR